MSSAVNYVGLFSKRKRYFKVKNEKKYYIPGLDEINQFVETPASRERTDRQRFLINTVLTTISAVAAVVAAIAAILALCR